MKREFEEDVCDYYFASQSDLRECDPTSWISKFKDVIQPCVLIPLPDHFLDYLQDPEYHIPPGTPTSGTADLVSASSSWASIPPQDDERDIFLNPSYVQQEEDADDDEFEMVLPPPPPPQGHHIQQEVTDDYPNAFPLQNNAGAASARNELFALFMCVLKREMDKLGGSVLPKLNWKAPKDARWIAFRNCLRCFLPGDICLLLKGSTIVDNVLSNPFKGCEDGNGGWLTYALLLSKWNDTFSPEFEFRCFVLNGKLTMICQKDESLTFSSIRIHRDDIILDIHNFFRRRIYHQFPLDYYVFDVMRVGKGKVILLDFNVFALTSYPSLTSYRELKLIAQETEENVKRDGGLSPSSSQLELKDKEKYGEPYFRYVTGNGDEEGPMIEPSHQISGPLPEDIVTYLRDLTL